MMALRKLARKVGRKSLAWGLNAERYEMSKNGEDWLIKTVSSRGGIICALDIGMNSGNWSKRVLHHAQQAKVHGFEPVPKFAENCRSQFVSSSVQVHEVAISDRVGSMEIFQAGGGGRSTDFPPTRKKLVPHMVNTTTVDAFVAENRINDISLIKVDTDGNDLAALRGMKETMSSQRPIIQFEYGRFWIGTRYFLRDAYDLFDNLDYKFGILMGKNIAYMKYSTSIEVFMNVNCVAIPNENTL